VSSHLNALNALNISAPSELIVLDACILMSGVLRPLLLNLAQTGLFEPVWSSYIGLEWRRNAARLWPINGDLLNDEWEQMQQRFPQACFDPPMVEALVNAEQLADAGPQSLSAPEYTAQKYTARFETLPKPLLRRSDAKDHHVIMAGVRAWNETCAKEEAAIKACTVSQQGTVGQQGPSAQKNTGTQKKFSANILTWNIRDFNRTELRQLHLGLLDPDQLLSGWWADHQPLITHHLECVIQTLINDGRRQTAPIADFLHRERLFRFKQLYLHSV